MDTRPVTSLTWQASRLPSPPPRLRRGSARRDGYTLVEILVAAALSLMLMGAVVNVFSAVGNSINNSRSALEAFDRLRATEAMLRMDLEGVTVEMLPPRRPEANEGYFEYIEGPRGVRLPDPATRTPQPWPVDASSGTNPAPDDFTVVDNDDILMFTTRSSGRPFVGKRYYKDATSERQETLESDVAEVAWFVRGRTLHRRVLLIAPGAVNLDLNKPGDRKETMWPTTPPSTYNDFFKYNDISVRIALGTGSKRLIGNTLGDLTKRECRFAHPNDFNAADGSFTVPFPYDARVWGQLGLPTLYECSSVWMAKWDKGTIPVVDPNKIRKVATADYWQGSNLLPDSQLYDELFPAPPPPPDPRTRVADDVVLTNVIGFDVKAWDPSVGAYVDLGFFDMLYDPQLVFPKQTYLSHTGCDGTSSYPKSALGAALIQTSPYDWKSSRVYDTWSFHYEQEHVPGLDPRPGNVPPDAAVNGFDDNPVDVSQPGNGIVDDAVEYKTTPPYPIPLRGIQVKIRIFEPDSRQIREVTIVQDFLLK